MLSECSDVRVSTHVGYLPVIALNSSSRSAKSSERTTLGPPAAKLALAPRRGAERLAGSRESTRTGT